MKTVLITGAAGGMGYAAARRLIQDGDRVYGLDLRAPESPEGMIFLQTDLTDEAAVRAARDRLRSDGVWLDAIVHMAGIYELDSLVELDDAAWQRVLDVNLSAACRINRIFLPLLATGGRILLTTSELAPLEPLPFTGVYAVTKAALDKYAEALRMELQLLGISVSVLRPGAVDTGLLNVSTQKLDAFCGHTRLYRVNAGRFRRIVERVETRKISPERVAALVRRILYTQRPRAVYTINRNPLLLLLNALPGPLRHGIIRCLLR